MQSTFGMRLDQNQPLILIGEKAYHLLTGHADCWNHHFGGDAIQLTSPDTNRLVVLQTLFRLDLSDPKLLPLERTGFLSLHYGFHYLGCQVGYQSDNGYLRLRELTFEEFSTDFPYQKYPSSFPIKPVRLEPVEISDVKEVVDSYAYLAQLCYVEKSFDPARYIYMVITPRKEYGVSLWGKEGDAAFVTVGFTIDIRSRMTKATQAIG